MKSIPLLTALLSLKALGVYAIDCNTDIPLDPNGPSGADIASSIQVGENGPVDDLCMNRFKDIEAGPIIYNAGPLVFSLSRTEGVLHPTGDCKSSLSNIISQCIVSENVWGGSVETDGLLFEISEGDGVDEVHKNEVRKIKTGKTKTPPKDKKKKLPKSKKVKVPKSKKAPKTKKPTSKKGTKTKKPSSKKPKSTKKPATKKHVSTKKPLSTKKPTSTKKPSTSSKISSAKCGKATGKSTGGKGGKGKRGEPTGEAEACPMEINWPKAFADAAKQVEGMLGEEKLLEARDVDTSPISGRDFYVGGMSGMRARREIEARKEIEKRVSEKKKLKRDKMGHVFKFDPVYKTLWNAGKYPTNADVEGTVSRLRLYLVGFLIIY